MRAPPDNGRDRGTDTPVSNLQQLNPPPSETSAIGMIPGRSVGVVIPLDSGRQRRVEREGWLEAGPDVCPPWCPWCFSPFWLGGSALSTRVRSS